MFSLQTKFSILKALITKKSPYYIQFYITGRCNLMCRQCNIVETNSSLQEMNLDQIRETAKNLKKIGAGIVLLTGGEPFIRDDLPQIVEAFKSQSLDVRLQTAGTKFATREKLQACYDAGARDINVSLDSLEFDKFDYINSVPGSALNAINTIELISDVFKKKSSILSLGTVLSRYNYFEVPCIVEFASRIGWYVSIVPVHITAEEKVRGFQSYDTSFNFSKNDFEKLDAGIQRLIEMKQQGYPIFDSVRFLKSASQFLKGHGPTWRKNNICDSPNLYFAIRPDGSLTTCCDYTLKEPPIVYSDSFVKMYRQGKIENRSDVQSIIKNCSGCHYGSYPEVTLSVRDFDAFMERTFLTFQMGRGTLSQAPITSQFVKAVEEVRKSHPEVYPTQQWLHPDITAEILRWNDLEKRKDIFKKDRELRVLQNRVRGKASP